MISNLRHKKQARKAHQNLAIKNFRIGLGQLGAVGINKLLRASLHPADQDRAAAPSC